jgi:hypothetical protein
VLTEFEIEDEDAFPDLCCGLLRYRLLIGKKLFHSLDMWNSILLSKGRLIISFRISQRGSGKGMMGTRRIGSNLAKSSYCLSKFE